MEITLKLSQEQAQRVLNALVKEPYVEVVEVVDTIQRQAAEQIETD